MPERFTIPPDQREFGVASVEFKPGQRAAIPDLDITDIRENCVAFLRHHQFDVVPSVSNKFMVDVKRPAMEVVQAMREENVYIGRVWQSWPTFCRVTVGTQEEMEIFQKAFLKVMA